MQSNELSYFRPLARCVCLAVFIGCSVMTAGCAVSPATRCLGEVLQQEIRADNDVYAGYRCTAGAHRGDSRNFSENTLAALKAAHDNPKYAFIEFDVQYSSDGRIVVFHDKRLLRIFGSLRSVGKTTFADLKALTGGEIAAYEDAMEAVKDKKINIEIKSQGDPEADARLADQIIADVKTRGREEDIMISSISGEVIRYVKRRYPEVPTGQIFWISASTFLHFDPLTERLYRKINDTQADYLMLHVANLRNIESLLSLKPENKTIVFWDFDDAIYVVHKNFSDRLWGQSTLRTAWAQLWFRLLFPFYCHRPDS